MAPEVARAEGKVARRHDINPMLVLHSLSDCSDPLCAAWTLFVYAAAALAVYEREELVPIVDVPDHTDSLSDQLTLRLTSMKRRRWNSTQFRKHVRNLIRVLECQYSICQLAKSGG